MELSIQACERICFIQTCKVFLSTSDGLCLWQQFYFSLRRHKPFTDIHYGWAFKKEEYKAII